MGKRPLVFATLLVVVAETAYLLANFRSCDKWAGEGAHVVETHPAPQRIENHSPADALGHALYRDSQSLNPTTPVFQQVNTDHPQLDILSRQHRFLDLEDLFLGCNTSRRLTIESQFGSGDEFDSRVRRWVENAEFLADCTDISDRLKHEAVPPILHRIWECEDIPKRYVSPLESWTNKSSEIVYALWTRAVRERFITKVLGSARLDLYLRLAPGAYRADLFRYIIMHHIGGFYSDVDTTLHVRLDELKFISKGVTVAVDVDKTRLLNGAILISPPRNPLFLCAMGEVFDHSELRKHFASDLDVSGPGVLGECLRHVVGIDEAIFDKQFASKVEDLGFHLLNSELRSPLHVVEDDFGTVVLAVEHGGRPYDRQVSADCDPGEHYGSMHKRNAVYHAA